MNQQLKSGKQKKTNFRSVYRQLRRACWRHRQKLVAMRSTKELKRSSPSRNHAIASTTGVRAVRRSSLSSYCVNRCAGGRCGGCLSLLLPPPQRGPRTRAGARIRRASAAAGSGGGGGGAARSTAEFARERRTVLRQSGERANTRRHRRPHGDSRCQRRRRRPTSGKVHRRRRRISTPGQ